MGMHQDHWPLVRQDMINEVNSGKSYQNPKLMFNVVGSSKEEVIKSLDHKSGHAGIKQWMKFPDHGFILADTYNRPVVVLAADGPFTYLPLHHAPPVPPPSPICIIFLRAEAHFVAFRFFSSLWPAPRVMMGWERHATEEAKRWKKVISPNIEMGEKEF